MKDLRSRCEKLFSECMLKSNDGKEPAMIEAFAREIRNKALEEAASILDGELLIDVPHPDETKIGVARRAVSNAAEVIRAAALAVEAKGDT